MSVDSTVATYCRVWAEPVAEVRERLLREVWDEDAVYSDPSVARVAGIAALGAHIGNFQRDYPGAQFRCSAAQTHHDVARFTWVISSSAGAEIVRGMDIVALGPDGRIRSITGFFGPPPELPR